MALKRYVKSFSIDWWLDIYEDLLYLSFSTTHREELKQITKLIRFTRKRIKRKYETLRRSKQARNV